MLKILIKLPTANTNIVINIVVDIVINNALMGCISCFKMYAAHRAIGNVENDCQPINIKINSEKKQNKNNLIQEIFEKL